jgi:hypothetical protein
MELTIKQKKKYIITLNNIYHQVIKQQIMLPKLTKKQIEILFDNLFDKTDNLYIPKIKNEYVIIDDNELETLGIVYFFCFHKIII